MTTVALVCPECQSRATVATAENVLLLVCSGDCGHREEVADRDDAALGPDFLYKEVPYCNRPARIAAGRGNRAGAARLRGRAVALHVQRRTGLR